ncbi:hypothetical protein BTVI_129928 [Pitangus sulphuratus]|nr:hypothetical protein BTVI_129928 [Pitangus sulphuratus]
MGARLSKDEVEFDNHLKCLIKYHGHSVNKRSLKALTKWIYRNVDPVPEYSTYLDWAKIGSALANAAFEGDERATETLTVRKRTLKILKKDRKSKRKMCRTSLLHQHKKSHKVAVSVSLKLVAPAVFRMALKSVPHGTLHKMAPTPSHKMVAPTSNLKMAAVPSAAGTGSEHAQDGGAHEGPAATSAPSAGGGALSPTFRPPHGQPNSGENKQP